MSRWEQNEIAGDVADFGYPDPEQWGGFVQAICAAPENDALRLIAADWLDEQGFVARAELIRVQCELALVPGERRVGRAAGVAAALRYGNELRVRERLMLDAVVPVWIPSCKGQWLWQRGFIEGATLTAADWLAHADDLLAVNPIRDVTLTTLVSADAILSQFHADGVQWTWLVTSDKRHRIVTYEKGLIELVAELLAAEWPGIRFTLPSEGVSFLRTIRESLE